MAKTNMLSTVVVLITLGGCADSDSGSRDEPHTTAAPSPGDPSTSGDKPTTGGGGTNSGATAPASRDAGTPALSFEPNFVVSQDGKLLVGGAGATQPSLDPSLPPTQGQDMMLARYGTDGKLDTSFGKNGYVALDFKGDPLALGMLESDLAMGVDLAADGKILLAGYGAGGSYNTGNAAALARLLPDGQPDPTFGINGKVLWVPAQTDRTEGHVFRVARADAQGRVYAAGDRGYDKSWLLRFDANGKVDPSFGEGSFIDPGISNVIGLFVTDKRVIYISRGFDAAAFTLDGTLDTSFGEGGYFEGGERQSINVEQLADGTIVMVGDSTPKDSHDNSSTLKVIAITPDGKPAAYGNQGIAEIVVEKDVLIQRGISVAEDRSVLVYYSSFGAPGLLRLTPSGMFDASFGAGAKQLNYKTSLVDLSDINKDQLTVAGKQAWIGTDDSPEGPLLAIPL